EPSLTLRVAEQAAIAGRQVAGVEVEQHHLEAGLGDRALHGIELLVPRPHELDAGEPGVPCAAEALGERRVLEEKAEVGREPHRRHRMRPPGRGARWLVICLAVLAALAPAAAAESGGLAPTPPMGWNDWYSAYCTINAQLVEQTAQTMVANGM